MTIDRDALLAALEGLASEDDETALKAARSAAAMVGAAELDWDEIIVPEVGAEPETSAPAVALDADDDAVLKTIDALLRRPNLHEGTREDLEGFREELTAGELDPEDRAYILKLHERVGSP